MLIIMTMTLITGIWECPRPIEDDEQHETGNIEDVVVVFRLLVI